MKRQFRKWILILLLLNTSILYTSDAQDRFPRTEQVKSLSPKNSSLFNMRFNTSALNWSYQAAYRWTDDPDDYWTYYHFNVSCTILRSVESFIFNFTYRLDIDNEKDEQYPASYHLLSASLTFNPYWYLKADLYHENSVDICYIFLSNPLNDSKSGSYEQSLVVNQEEAPLGYYYTSIVSGRSVSFSHGRGESVYINKAQLSSYYDSRVLWVKDLTNFTFTTNFHLTGFDFSLDFLGSYTSFLGDGIHFANSSIEMEYLQNITINPAIITDFNISVSLQSQFGQTFEGHTSWQSRDYLPNIILNHTNFQNSSFLNIEYLSTNVVDGIWTYTNNTWSPLVFNSTYLEQEIVFQLNSLPAALMFELEIRQIVPEEVEPESDSNSISGFPIPLLVGGIFVICLRMIKTKKKENA